MSPPRRPTRPAAALLAMVALLAAVTGCGAPAGQSPAPAAGGTPSWAAPPPSGPGQPSASALQVCSPDDGQQDIAAALGVTPTRVEPPTWVNHLYSCRYIYPDGSFTLSVKELPDNQSTGAYLDGLAAQRGNLAPLDGVGQAAFYTRDKSIVARKDFKVLLVDVSALPPEFGKPPAPPAAVSRTIATVIMGCWSGD